MQKTPTSTHPIHDDGGGMITQAKRSEFHQAEEPADGVAMLHTV